MQIKSITVIFVVVLLFSCGNSEKSDAYGNFEATSVTISAKGNGELLQFNIKEGMKLQKGINVGLIDTTQLHLEKLQVIAKLEALDFKLQEAAPEIAILLKRKSNLDRERNRTQNLVAKKAATQKQLDDYNGEIEVVDQQISSTTRQINIANRSILSERKPLEAQIAILRNKINDHEINNPIEGTVLSTFVEVSELVNQGRPLYKIANLNTLKLKAYTSALLLQKVKLNDKVTVLIDSDEDSYTELEGIVTWIADEAEFTPKSIETKEERVNLVYALDVEVKNDGLLKIGMPAEVVFSNKNRD
ncbi:HlyD family efflux transporter periplasmic adaptor subunit [Flavivirga aquimarina]|uniref:HlyD family efflux transporter periplasmic adaptor subunit n=1 Tax=Flavivirga aquimarina TaxID=2027862 RepID=A0ABT8WAL0_9FLAO|nr:HlyD family efflux transporter periplasmic adaptor subunit [Flavivirga aquimarina]MDO5970140.1 HlyD family efflux transporter periplasmic adaptor subunit [Flavivirga aquimarina]